MVNIKEVEKFANKYYKKLGKDILPHIALVRKYALQLAEIEGADKNVVDIAAILHDIGKYKGREGHSEVSRELAKEFFKDKDLPEQKKELILKCISKHSTRFAQEDNELEVKVLQSADALAALFEDEWQEYCRKKYPKDELLKIYDKTFNKINIESAKRIAEPKIKELKNILRK